MLHLTRIGVQMRPLQERTYDTHKVCGDLRDASPPKEELRGRAGEKQLERHLSVPHGPDSRDDLYQWPSSMPCTKVT
jgi:hypothetical protein